MSADPWSQLAEAAEMIQDAARRIAAHEAAAGRRAIDDFVGVTRSKLSDLEEMAEKGIARITGR